MQQQITIRHQVKPVIIRYLLPGSFSNEGNNSNDCNIIFSGRTYQPHNHNHIFQILSYEFSEMLLIIALQEHYTGIQMRLSLKARLMQLIAWCESPYNVSP